MQTLFEVIFLLPLAVILLLGVMFFFKLQPPEKILSECMKWFSFGMIVMTTVQTALVIHFASKPMFYEYANWIEVGGYEFKIRFIVDLLGSTYATLTTLLIGIIFRYSRNYLHKEEGYYRFIFLLCTLTFGLLIVSFARTLDFIFGGWELVGTTSVLLIGYFYSQNQPVRHSLKAMVSYRFCDMGILAASAYAHHYLETTDFTLMPSMIAHSHGGPLMASLIGIFIIWGSLAKSGQLPFSSWLPTAMEGPTPSSAIFYGALSSHLGPFLLLRFYSYFEHFPALLWAIGIIGALSAIYASAVGRTRTDAKTMLAYATISQVGIIWIEIACGFTKFALFHMVAHASLRTWQYLRSASLIQDFFENPLVKQDELIHRKISIEKYFSKGYRKRFYIHALHEFHLDYFTRKVLDILSWPFKVFIEAEKRWMTWNNHIIKSIIKR